MASNIDVSAAPPQIKHDVFVNFRGKDTRNNFTSHLLAALDRNGIDAFTDKGLKGGEAISTTLSNKICESQVSVVVFSQNYAESKWCLDELVRIMQCKDVNGQTVLPVFLQEVEPTHVRHQTATFGKAFGRLLRDAPNADKVESWRHALKQAANLSGWHSDKISEGEIVEKLLTRIQSVLDQMSSDDSYRHFVGIERVEEVESCLSSPNLRCLGIWGMGGSGKTTIAEKIYERISKNFDAACFLEKVREFVERQESNYLRKYMLFQLLGKHDRTEGSPIIFHGDIQRKLRRKRVLVVFDDVSDVDQIQELIGNCNLYHPKSKMIVTSRDKQVLKYVCDNVYKVQKLNDHESLQLLKFHTFKQRQPTPYHMELLEEAIKYTRGLPLFLVVLGRNLFDRDITIWKNELAKLSDYPDLKIMNILKTSFDGLEDTEKSIFLDIACVLHGWDKDRVESILDACGFYAIRGIARLIDKALITISYHTIRMHDLVQQMGQHIAFHETHEPRRLWRNKDIIDFLTKKQETERMRKMEVISMDLPKVGGSVRLKSRVFKKMTRLRILRFHNGSNKIIKITLPDGLEYLPDELRYLEWDQYPLPSMPPRFNPENLVELHMVHSNLKQLWIGEVEPCLPNLKCVNLTASKNLMILPNFRTALKLEKLLVPFCENLADIPDSIQHLVELKYIVLQGNKSLARLPELSQLTKLENLSLMGCSRIQMLPQLPQNLISLSLSLTKIKQLPSSVQRMSQLEYLLLGGCEQLESILDSVGELKNLQVLDLDGCSKLSTLPTDLGYLKSLKRLATEGIPLNSLPASVSCLSSLTELNFSGYKGDTLPSLKGLVSLEELHLHGSNLKSLPEDIKYLSNLWCINLVSCKSLSSIPELPPSLGTLEASNCTSLKKYTHRPLQEVGHERNFATPEFVQLRFCNCINLEQDARNQIYRDLWLRLQFILLPAVEKMYYEGDTSTIFLTGIVYFPGNEVPGWFEYSQTGSSLQVNTNSPRRLHHPFRFIFCAVVTFPDNFIPFPMNIIFTCKCVTNSGENLDSEGQFAIYYEDPVTLHQTTHTFLWCEYFGRSEFRFSEATFQFSVSVQVSEGWAVLDGLEIVKCGVTPIGTTFGTPQGLPAVIDDGDSHAVEGRASLLKRPEKRKRGNDDDDDDFGSSQFYFDEAMLRSSTGLYNYGKGRANVGIGTSFGSGRKEDEGQQEGDKARSSSRSSKRLVSGFDLNLPPPPEDEETPSPIFLENFLCFLIELIIPFLRHNLIG